MGSVKRLKGFGGKFSAVLGVATITGIVLWNTKLPESSKENCDRECHELEWPLICRYKIVLETQGAQSNYQKCLHNQTNNDVYCGKTSNKIITANKQYPGPTIKVCQSDIIVIDIVNRIPGHSLSLHWRGQYQKETPVMDGAPMITQCSILPHTTFQYKFRATEAGTHWWQVLSGDELTDKLFGGFVVKQSRRQDPHFNLYDHDEDTLLIENAAENGTYAMRVNGILLNTSMTVKTNSRYRFRAINFGGDLRCPLRITVDQHYLTIIAMDGHGMEPKTVSDLEMKPDETLDFVLTTRQGKGDFDMVFESVGRCVYLNLTYTMTINYNSSLNDIINDMKNPIRNMKAELSNSQTTSLSALPHELSAPYIEQTIYLGFSTVKYHFGTMWSMPNFNNISMVLPSEPLLLNQPEDIDVCETGLLPKRCRPEHRFCECTHIVELPLGSATELVLFDAGTEDRTGEPHSFHLHGYSLHVVGEKQKAYVRSVEQARKLDKAGKLLIRTLDSSLLKNTFSVPPAGVTAVRFIADNPGFWLFRSEKTSVWSNGLSLIFKIIPSGSFPPVPEDFPRCGNFIGPDFFLA
ncbi:uncharacterized protein LOC126843171 isoform X2 [Adelges cooleyi]|uniref:uncharacterized protein LOC126843171 isoform X2 n=1 Tax=Adelges cooleyi TaxID=133065 RepID=UPI0021809BBC|nr:uncharacterized protein LOC126843171 isoform X2 [Adelges cooleyi]